MGWEKILKKIDDFIRERVESSGARGVVLGLSGGVDSALVALLCKRALGERVFALLMPTKHSAKAHLDDALGLCADLNLAHKILPIQPILDAFLAQSAGASSIRMGNFAARIRMSLLYDLAALKDYLVVGTSNKSELMLGYGTIYGDLACAFNPIGSLYKSEIYALSAFLNLPSAFLTKPASADLWEDQSDEGDLGFSYAQIDAGLEALEKGDEGAISRLDAGLLAMLKQRIQRNAFKRKMPEILELRGLL